MQSQFDYFLFTRKVGDKIVIILIDIDNLLIIGNDHILIHEQRQLAKKKFKIKDLDEIKYYFSIKIARSQKKILLYQREFTLEVLQI